MQKKRIVSLTLNPAVDEHYETCRESDGGLRLVGRDRGGKGINVTRALHNAGVESICYVVIGERDREEFLSGEDISHLKIHARTVRGGVRTNRHIHTPSGDMVESGTSEPLADADIIAIFSELDRLVDEGDVLAVCGSAPAGTNTSLITELLIEQRKRGVQIIIDSRTLSLEKLSMIRPIMIKPNAEEAEQYLGYPLNESNIYNALGELAAPLGADVLLTLGEDGACLYSGGGIYRARSHSVEVKSTTGAGDSTVCAYIIGILRDLCAPDILRLAVAFGCAACGMEGSAPPDPCRVKELYEGITVELVK